MKALLIALVLVSGMSAAAQARIRYINPYIRSDGTSVSGHYRDTSNDGYEYNNANYLGWN